MRGRVCEENGFTARVDVYFFKRARINEARTF